MFNKIFSKFIKDSENVENAVVRGKYGKFSSIVGISFNILLFIGKVLAGILTGSVAVIADALNNLSDASSNVVGYFGFKLSSMPADEEHPYGHGRFEYIAGLTVAFIIMMIGVELLKTSIEKIIKPSNLTFSVVALIILATSIIIKFFLMLFYRAAGKKISSDTLLASSQDSRNDAISTAVVLISTIVSSIWSINLDGYMGIIVALFILISGFGIVKNTINTLLGKAPDKEFVKKINDKILSYEHILGTHDLLVHDYGPGRIFASVHVEMPAEVDPMLSHEIIDNIENDFKAVENVHISIHYDPVSTNDELLGEMKEYLYSYLASLGNITAHDLRIVRGPHRNIAVFDIALPYNSGYTEKEIKKLAHDKIVEKYSNFVTNITIDRTFG